MKKLILAIGLLLSLPAQALTTVYRDGSDVVTVAQVNTDTVAGTEAIPLGPYQAGSVQCIWASVTGVQPVFALQLSNNNSNWDTLSSATTTTTGAAGSSTWIVDPFVSRYARIYISTTSTTGNLNCISVLKRG